MNVVKSYGFCLGLLLLGTHMSHAKICKLESPALKLLDGVPFALDGPCMKDMLCIRREVRKIQFGEKDPTTNTLRGHYQLGDHHISIHQLARIEHEIETDIAMRRDAAQGNEAALRALDQERLERLAPLQPCLRCAKDDFKRINEPYLESIKGTKSMMISLVEESCHKHDRMMSFLMKWAHVAEGQELESFEENITNLRELDMFCTDLTNFMDDVIHSCPKGCAQAGLKLN
jgi:hypothetical protein